MIESSTPVCEAKEAMFVDDFYLRPPIQEAYFFMLFTRRIREHISRSCVCLDKSRIDAAYQATSRIRGCRTCWKMTAIAGLI